MSSTVIQAFELLRSPISLLSMKTLMNYNIDPRARFLQKRTKENNDSCIALFNNRRKEGKKTFLNLLDMVLEHQDSLPEGKKLSEEEMAGILILLNVAGSDTSSTVCKGVFYETSFNKDAISTLKSIIEPFQIDKAQNEEEREKIIQKLVQDQTFDNYIKEFLRMYPPLGFSPSKRLIKNVKLGGYKLKSGDLIFPMVGVRHFSRNLFKDPQNFRPRRFEDKKDSDNIKQNIGYCPFGLGPRNCIGQYLAYLYIKCFTICLATEFESKQDETCKKMLIWSVVTELKDSRAYLRPRV